MKPIQKDELFEHVSSFLKGKGIELKDGSYSKTIQNGCSLLADAVNLSQQGLSRAKDEVDKGLDRMRQVIHQKTAPKQKSPPQEAKPTEAPPKTQSQKRKPKAPKHGGTKSKSAGAK
jgi:hypothetical protein